MISALRAAIEKIPTREERLGGQTFKYVKLSEVLDLLDTFRSNNADETQPAALNPKLQTRLREIAESLLCREGSGHYCPNCGNTTFDAAMSLKLLADQIGAPDETTDWRSIARARGEVLDKLSDQIAALKKTELTPEEPSGPRGKPCTCPDTSAAACGVERGHKLGELWFCKRAQVKAK